jgi:hypothetical protein
MTDKNRCNTPYISDMRPQDILLPTPQAAFVAKQPAPQWQEAIDGGRRVPHLLPAVLE